MKIQKLLHFRVLVTKKLTCSQFNCQLVPGTGIEPVWYRYRRILSPVRLPVPPPGHLWSLSGDSNSRPLD